MAGLPLQPTQYISLDSRGKRVVLATSFSCPAGTGRHIDSFPHPTSPVKQAFRAAALRTTTAYHAVAVRTALRATATHAAALRMGRRGGPQGLGTRHRASTAVPPDHTCALALAALQPISAPRQQPPRPLARTQPPGPRYDGRPPAARTGRHDGGAGLIKASVLRQ